MRIAQCVPEALGRYGLMVFDAAIIHEGSYFSFFPFFLLAFSYIGSRYLRSLEGCWESNGEPMDVRMYGCTDVCPIGGKFSPS